VILTSKKKILVVEDDPASRDYLKTLLVHSGYDVVEAENGAHALAEARRERPDLVISDILMPVMDGFELAQEIRLVPELSDLPILFYSATYHEKQATWLGQACGVTERVTKPADPEVILSAIEKALHTPVPLLKADPYLLAEEHARVLAQKVAVTVKELIDNQHNVERETGLRYQTLLEHHDGQIRLQAAALEASSNPIVITDRAGIVVWVNPAFTRLTGYAANQVVGQTPRVWSSGKQDRQYYENLWETILSGEVWQREIVNRRQDGSLYTEEMTITPVYSNSGEICNFVAVKQDLTERNEAAKSLFMAQFAVEHTADAAFWVGPDGAVRNVNEAACNTLGYSKSELLGLHVWDFDPDVRREQWEGAWSRLKEHRSLQQEATHVRKNGTRVPVETVITHLEFHGMEYAFTLVRDISERKKAEQEIKEAEERYRDIFENVPVGIFRSTPEGRFLQVSPWMARDLGYSSPAEQIAAIGNIATQLYVNPARHKEFTLLMKQQGIVRDFGFEAYKKDGAKAWLICNVREVRGADGHIAYYDGTVEDVTEKKLLESQLQQAQKMELVGRLSGSVAHDFNNLLTIISGCSDLLVTGLAEDSHQRKYAGHIKKAATSAAGITRQLLAFSRKRPGELETLDLNGVLMGLEDMLRHVLGRRIELVIKAQAPEARLAADRSQIEQVIVNLAVNARDAMPRGGSLRVETFTNEFRSDKILAPGKYVGLRVIDTGEGIEPAVQNRLFEPFFSTKGERGTGLGLANVSRIAKQSGGDVRMQSKVGKGSTFTVHFPLSTLAPPQPDFETQAQEIGGSESILLVDDEAVIRMTAFEYLTDMGYRVREAASGNEALSAILNGSGSVDLMVTDVTMPTMSGIDLAECVRELRPGLPVLFISGFADSALDEMLTSLPPNMAYIRKPFDLASLASNIRSLLDRRAQHRQRLCGEAETGPARAAGLW
jgi:two-component system, cell cycle sensor histidine kinase and response regulator CckA